MRNQLSCDCAIVLPLLAFCMFSQPLLTDNPPMADRLRGALLWYESCETIKGRNEHKGVRIIRCS